MPYEVWIRAKRVNLMRDTLNRRDALYGQPLTKAHVSVIVDIFRRWQNALARGEDWVNLSVPEIAKKTGWSDKSVERTLTLMRQSTILTYRFDTPPRGAPEGRRYHLNTRKIAGHIKPGVELRDALIRSTYVEPEQLPTSVITSVRHPSTTSLSGPHFPQQLQSVIRDANPRGEHEQQTSVRNATISHCGQELNQDAIYSVSYIKPNPHLRAELPDPMVSCGGAAGENADEKPALVAPLRSTLKVVRLRPSEEKNTHSEAIAERASVPVAREATAPSTSVTDRPEAQAPAEVDALPPGLSDDAAAAFAHLMVNGPATRGALASDLAWGGTRAYQVADALMAAGLITHDRIGQMVPILEHPTPTPVRLGLPGSGD